MQLRHTNIPRIDAMSGRRQSGIHEYILSLAGELLNHFVSCIPKIGSAWLFPVPWAFRNLLNFIHDEFDSSKYPILVTENGLSSKDLPGIPTNGTDFSPVLDDQFRVTFYNGKSTLLHRNRLFSRFIKNTSVKCREQ